MEQGFFGPQASSDGYKDLSLRFLLTFIHCGSVEWKLPLHLHEHIEAIQPTTSFLRTIQQSNTWTTVPAGTVDAQPYHQVEKLTVQNACNKSAVTPLCLRTLYETVNYKPQVPGKNVVALTDYLGEINNRTQTHHYTPPSETRTDGHKQQY